jgi:hypothetical protein
VRLSVDAVGSSAPKPAQELKKHKRRSSNLFGATKPNTPSASNPKQKEPTPPTSTHTHRHPYPYPACNTAKNSTNATRTNSPIKHSLANSHLLPAPTLIKNYKFFYQIGFGAFGRVWKVAERESAREYALKEISKCKYLGIDSECWRSAM